MNTNQDLCDRVIANLSNLANIHSNYSILNKNSKIDLLKLLSKFELNYSSENPNQSQDNQKTTTNNNNNNNNQNFESSASKRPQQISVEQYHTYKLRKFDKNCSLNINNPIPHDSRLNFDDIVDSNNEISEIKMFGLINLNVSLKNFQSKYNIAQPETELEKNDFKILEIYEKNVLILLKTASSWLSKELILNYIPNNNKSRYELLLEEILKILNKETSLEEIVVKDPENRKLWEEFITKLPSYNEDIVDHVANVNEYSFNANSSNKTPFLSAFKMIIVNNLNSRLGLYALSKFLKTMDVEGIKMTLEIFWKYEQFRSEILDSADDKFEFIKKNKASGDERVQLRMKENMKFYITMINKEPNLMQGLFLGFGDLAPIAQNFFIDKFDNLEKKMMNYLTQELQITLFQDWIRNEKLLVKLVERYARNPLLLGENSNHLLMCINRFCFDKNLVHLLIPLAYLNEEDEFNEIVDRVIFMRNRDLMGQLIALIYETNGSLAEILFVKFHDSFKEEMSDEEKKFIRSIHHLLFFVNEIEKNPQPFFFSEEKIVMILGSLSSRTNISPIFMLSMAKTYNVFNILNKDIYLKLFSIIEFLVVEGLYKDKNIWDGMKWFLVQGVKKILQCAVDLINRLPREYKVQIKKSLD